MYKFIILLFSSTLLFCHNKKENISSFKVQEKELIIFDLSCNKIDPVSSKLNSELKIKANKLRELENRYQLKNYKEIDLVESMIFNGLDRLQNTTFPTIKYEIKNINTLKSSIIQTNKCFIKGDKDLGKQFYARAIIEEIIFKSAYCAEQVFIFLDKIRIGNHTWEDFDKAPNSVFKIDNIIYYIGTGGWYMMDFYKKIETKMKEK